MAKTQENNGVTMTASKDFWMNGRDYKKDHPFVCLGSADGTKTPAKMASYLEGRGFAKRKK